MTKLKNTKKGMAKKALSISLVAAMLATSNVPVWAAEFSDGTDVAPVVVEQSEDVDVFSAEAEEPIAEVVEDVAPVAVEETEEPSTVSSITEASDLIATDVAVSGSATFSSGKVNVTGNIYYKNGGDLTELKEYSFGWRVKGQTAAIFTDKVGADNTTAKMAFTPEFAEVTNNGSVVNDYSQAQHVDWSKYVGQTLELYIFNNEDSTDAIKIAPTVIGTTVINKCDMTGATLRLNKNNTDPAYQLVYNGKTFQYTDGGTGANDVTINADDTSVIINIPAAGDAVPGNNGIWTKEELLKYFDVSASQTALNAGDKLIVTATAKADSPYSGTIYADTLVVQKRAYVSGDLFVTVDNGITYPYTGKAVTIKNSNVHLTESKALSGADLSGAIVKAATTGSGLGNQTVAVTIDKKLLTNFSFQVPDTTWELTTSDAPEAAKVQITQRDLEKDTDISIKYGGKVLDKTSVADFINTYLVIKDKDGTVLNGLTYDRDYVVTVYDSDGQVVTTNFNGIGNSYRISVTAKKNEAAPSAQTCIKGQELTVTVTDNIVGGVSYSNQNTYKPYYTGVAIQPTKAELGDLSITGLDGRKVTFQSDQWEFTGNYTNNVNAATYTANGSVKTYAYAEAKILGSSSYAGQTIQIPFEIQPLTVSESSVTVPATITYNKGYGAASEYNVPLVVTAKDETGKIVKGLSAADYTVKFDYIDGTKSDTKGVAKNELHDLIKATITIKNSNFMGDKGKFKEIVMTNSTKHTEIVEKAITSDMIKINPSSYTYTGGNIIPSFVVMDGVLVLYDKADYGPTKGEYEVVSITNNKEVGDNTAKVTVKGMEGKYSGTASATFSITPANTSDVKVEFTAPSEYVYTGRQVRPRAFKATLNGNDVTSQFEIAGYGENISGKGTVTLKPVDGNKNFTGSNITVEFNIIKEVITAELSVYNANGANVTNAYRINVNTDNKQFTSWPTSSFTFDGNEKKFATALLSNIAKQGGGKTTATADDLEIKYVDNISGNRFTQANGVNYNVGGTAVGNSDGTANIGYIYAVAKDGTGFAGTKTIVTADGTLIKGVVDVIPFVIDSVKFVKQNVSVTNATYAGGLPVRPNVLVQIGGTTLVEGKDYSIKLTNTNGQEITPIDVTDGAVYNVVVTGINGYAGSEVVTLKWGVDKKNLKDCDIKVVNGVVTVMNGYIPVPTTEYTSVKNADGTYTITANTASKGYVGSKTVSAEGKAEDEKPDAPMIIDVQVTGNKAKVILSGETDGATGYDYVISTDRDCITNKDYDKVNKNILTTNTTFTYTDQGVYYAYCHAWKRGADGKKIFSGWSNAYPFAVSAITPSQPGITSVKVSGSTVTVTYTKCTNATGYDIVLGSAVKKVNGEMRPVEYGTLVKKITKGNTVTATFKNVKKGTYYAGLHAYNRTSEDGKKVFSPWSNTKKVNVK